MSDVPWVRDDVKAVLTPSDTAREVTSGVDLVLAARERAPDLAVLDMQTGQMGGMATCLELRLEESADRLPHVPVLLLLDRRPDVFLARRAQAEGYVLKPVDPIRLRRAFRALLAGGTYEDPTRAPVPVLVGAGQDEDAAAAHAGPGGVAGDTATDIVDATAVAAVEQGGGDG